MKDELISQYIDDELDLDEKIEFVEMVHEDGAFKDEAVALLRIEKDLRLDVVTGVPEVRPRFSLRLRRAVRNPVLAAAASAALVLLAVFLAVPTLRETQEEPSAVEAYRFVLYEPRAAVVEVAGDFTGWRRVTMERAGSSGYWERSAKIPPGDYRYIFIIDGRQRVADPTALARERDEYGAENSIVTIGGRA